jgi:hypothetical protein
MASFVAVIAEARKGFRGWRPKMSRYRVTITSQGSGIRARRQSCRIMSPISVE